MEMKFKEKKINKKKIKKYVGIGLLTATLTAGVGLVIYDKQIDHTQEVCPITKLFSIPALVGGEYTPGFTLGVALHQWPEMQKEYADKGIEDVSISFGKITKEVSNPPVGYMLTTDGDGNSFYVSKVLPTAKTLEDGSIIYSAPAGYTLTTDENGNSICIKKIALEANEVDEIDMGYGFRSTWGGISYDQEIGSYVFKNEEYLKVK